MSTDVFNGRAIDELLQEAAKYATMAAGARTLGVGDGLLRIAERFRNLAWQRAGGPVYRPGELAAETGLYHQLDAFGTPTGVAIDALRRAPLPLAPSGFTWRLADRSPVA
jgi:hypothetical protein